MSLKKVSANGKVKWDSFEREDIAQEVHSLLVDEPAKDLFSIVKKYCKNLGPNRSRTIASLTQVPWLESRVRSIHHDWQKAIQKRHEELRHLQAKPKIREMTDEERIQDMPTWLLLMETVRRTDRRLTAIERKLT